jgi:hypothetical protein
MSFYITVMGAGVKVEDPPTGGDEIPPWRGKNPAYRQAGMTNNLPILSALARVLLINRLDINYYGLFFFIISISLV